MAPGFSGVVTFFNYLLANPWIFVLLFLLYCFIYALSIFISGPKPGRNPFFIGNVRPPKPLTFSVFHKTYTKCRFHGFKVQRVPENIDTIVIGSGIGGLSTAVLLGRAGYKVLVLEQHDQAGGCCHTFVDKGYEFDTGIHYVGKMMEGDMTRILTDQITEGQVVWEPMDKEFDSVALGDPGKARWFTLTSGTREEFAHHLKKQFPTEEAGIDKFMKMLNDCRGAFMGIMIPKMLPLWLAELAIKTGIYQLFMRKFMKLSKLTLKDALEDMTDNAELKAVVSYIFGDIGVMPSELSVVNYAALINHYLPGAFYPLGGTSEIAFQIVPIIEKYGGRVFVDAPVSQILLNEKGKAHGVRVSRNNNNFDLFAKRIISDAGVINTFKHLLPQEVAVKAPLYKYINKIGPSVSCLTVFAGFEGTSSDLGLNKGNIWAFMQNDLEEELKSYISMNLEDAADSDCPLMFISFPSAKDSSWEDRFPGKSVALLITLLPWSWFNKWEGGRVKHRGEDYNELKERIAKQMWRQCEQLFPKLDGKLTYLDVGTPLSNKYYIGQPEGEMYGLNHSLKRFDPEMSMHLRAESGIPGLWLTGQDIVTCGFSGALHAGMITASKILHRNLVNDLTAVTKETRKLMKMTNANGKKTN